MMKPRKIELYKKKVQEFLDRKFPDGYVLTWLNDKQFSLQTSAPIFDKETNEQIGAVSITCPTCEIDFSEDDALLVVLQTTDETVSARTHYHSWEAYKNHPFNKRHKGKRK